MGICLLWSNSPTAKQHVVRRVEVARARKTQVVEEGRDPVGRAMISDLTLMKHDDIVKPKYIGWVWMGEWRSR